MIRLEILRNARSWADNGTTQASYHGGSEARSISSSKDACRGCDLGATGNIKTPQGKIHPEFQVCRMDF